MDQTALPFLPLIALTIVVIVLAVVLCMRKGKSLLWVILCMIPVIGWFGLFFLASLPDKEVLDRLAALEGRRN